MLHTHICTPYSRFSINSLDTHIAQDGTVDSICYRCIATVATVYDESKLARFEHDHVCDPAMVERFSRIEPTSSEPVRGSRALQSWKLG